MSAADQQNQGKQGSDPADASFERLLAQLESGAAPSRAGSALKDGSVSQIFSAPPGIASAHQDPAATAILPAQARVPQESSAFAPPASIPASEPTLIALKPAEIKATALSARAEFKTPQGAISRAPAGAAPEPLPPQVEAPQVEAPSAQEPPGEFTRIFTQLPTPRSAPPAILADLPAQPATARPPAPGEFTQFFQARDQAGLEPSIAGAPAAQPPTPAPPGPITSLERALPQEATAPPGLNSLPPPRAASQAFAPASSSAFLPSLAADAAFARPVRETPSPASAAGPGDFTALFQTPSAAPSTPPAPPASAPQPSSFAPTSRSPFAEPEPFKPNAAAGGGFTELLRSLSDNNPAAGSPAPAQAPSFPQGAPGSRLDAFSPVAAPAPQPSGNRNQFSADQSFAARVPDPAGPFAPQRDTPAPPAGAAGPGEFTQLMQSLAEPGASKPAAAPPAQTPFFSENAKLSTAGPSEFTRVIQGSAARSAQATPATFTPAAPSSGGAAVGLPIAAPPLPKPPAPPAAEPKTTLQKLMPWLLLANGLLLILLIGLAVVFLKRH